jgi:4-hydroxy-tetrahydrodipicolinate synthase
MRAVIEETRRRVPVIAGTGSNNTAESVFLTKKAAELKADGALVIMPYYNKPMPAGQMLHFKAVCAAGRIPVMVYNVPSRTAKRIEAEDIARMYKEIDEVVAVKDAVGDIEFTCKTRSLSDIQILSGDDSMTFPMIAVGGQGVISVASNVAPAAVTAMVKAANAGDFPAARRMHYALWDLFKGLFIETNPIPVKTALELMGRAPARLRLPLSAIEDKNLVKLQAMLKAAKLIA